MSKATERPWDYLKGGHTIGKNGIFVAEASPSNCELIVKAVNSYYYLVEACKFALANTNELEQPLQYKKLENALRRAKGE